MKNRSLLIGCIVFPIIAIIGFVIGFLQHSDGFGSKVSPKKNLWLQINMSGDIPDYNEVEEGLGTQTASVQEICSKLKIAATDSKVKGIILNPNFALISMAGVNEISEAIKTFKASKKPVLAHLDLQSQKDYQIAALADTIAMEPSQAGGLLLEGVASNMTFYKILLDKLGLKVHIIRSGQFKGYGETYSQTAMSPGTYDNIRQILGKRYELIIAELAKQRKLPQSKVRAIFESRPDYIVNADYAVQNGLVDVRAGKDDFLKQHQIDKDHLISLREYQIVIPNTDIYTSAQIAVPNTKSVAVPFTGSKGKIAIIYLQGGIVSQTSGQMGFSISGDKIQSEIDEVTRDKSIKAVVLRVNSPGGSAMESEIIYRKLSLLRKSMPVVVSMSGVAASGGYYISAASDYIIADPYTITGSIGVIQLLPDASVLSQKVGITDQTIGFGKYSGAMNLWNTPSPDLLASLQRNSTNVYNEFKSRVATNRKLDFATLDNIAEGRVWSAEAALKNGLIDQIGTLDTAIQKAASLSKLSSWQTIILPRPKSYWSVIMEQINERFTSLKQSSTMSLTAILQKQMEAIFTPYASLCILPFTLD